MNLRIKISWHREIRTLLSFFVSKTFHFEFWLFWIILLEICVCFVSCATFIDMNVISACHLKVWSQSPYRSIWKLNLEVKFKVNIQIHNIWLWNRIIQVTWNLCLSRCGFTHTSSSQPFTKSKLILACQ